MDINLSVRASDQYPITTHDGTENKRCALVTMPRSKRIALIAGMQCTINASKNDKATSNNQFTGVGYER